MGWEVILGMLVVVFGLAAAPSVAAEEVDLSLSPEWKRAIEPLRDMPVQYYGFIRSAYTFGDNQLMEIAKKQSIGGADALETVLQIMIFPEKVRNVALLKVGHPELAESFGSSRISLADYRKPEVRPRVIGLIRDNQEKWTRPVNQLEGKAQLLEGLEAEFAIIPQQGGAWLPPTTPSSKLDETGREIAARWGNFKSAMRADDPSAGHQAAEELAAAVRASAQETGHELPNLGLDVFYHRHEPFKRASLWYVLAMIAYAGSYLLTRPKLGWIGFGLLSLGFLEQAVGVVARWILSGRAPLSNMFESFTFAIWGMVLVALVFEALNRTRLFGLGASMLGFIFMVLAHQAPIFHSQIRPLMPALQSSWLTYHVVTIMLSYSAFTLSFFVSVIYLVKDVLFAGDNSNAKLIKHLPSLNALDVFNYRIIAVGFPLLTLGIVLGAVWAATAWGRPWGFDPKETWSAITWLVYAIYLHVRYLAGWKGRRAAILALIGFGAMLFTYLGVNYLLPGLHSYV